MLLLTILILLSGCLNSRFYSPNQIVYDSPENYGLTYEAVVFESGDKTLLSGWFIEAVGDPIGTVVHFHGNYGNISYYLNQIAWLPKQGFNVFTFDYRGYGNSAGIPDRSGIQLDALAALRFVASKTQTSNPNLFVFAQSLGGAAAVSAITSGDFPAIRAVALEGAFFSYRGQARDAMGAAVRDKLGPVPCLSLQLWPLSFLAVSDAYSPGEKIHKLSPIPVLLIHCTDDQRVPYHHSKLFYERAKEPKELWIADNCGHLALFAQPNAYREKLAAYFKKHHAK